MVLVGLRTRLQGDETLPAPDIATATAYHTPHNNTQSAKITSCQSTPKYSLPHHKRKENTYEAAAGWHLHHSVPFLAAPARQTQTHFLPSPCFVAHRLQSLLTLWEACFIPCCKRFHKSVWAGCNSHSNGWIKESLGQWNCCSCRELGHRVGQWRFIFWRGGGRGVVGVWVNGDGIWGQKARVRLPSVHGHVRHGPPASLTPLLQNTKD